MKTLVLFYWDNCPPCAAIKDPIFNMCKEKGYTLVAYHEEWDARKFRDYRVMWKPTVIEIDAEGKEIEGTRQQNPIDLSKY